MPEHVHLLIWPRPVDYDTSRILADIKRPVGQQAVAWLEVNSPGFLERLTVRNRSRTYRRFWQAGPGQDRNIYDPETAYEVIEYMHGNPVRRDLVARPEDWPWSSAADWAGCQDVLLNVDRTIPPVTELCD
jgi:putative transposase